MTESGKSIDFGKGKSHGKKGGKNGQGSSTAAHDYKANGLRALSLTFLTPKSLEYTKPKARTFALRGSMHLQVVASEQMSLAELIHEFTRDFARQIAQRIEVMKEEAQS